MTKMMKNSLKKLPQLEGLLDLQKIFPTEQDCIKYLEERRWKGVITSPHDPTSRVYKCKDNRYKCKNTNRYFNAKTETIFESSNLPLLNWFYVLYIFVNHKKGISSYQLARNMKITQKSAWFMLHRLRKAFKCSICKVMLKGIVEIDETFLGGSNSNRHKDKKVPHCQGRNWKDKIPVLGMLERSSGDIICQVVSDTKMKTLVPIIKTNIEKGSNINSDEWYRNSSLNKDFKHQIVNHSAKQYAKGDVSVNGIENRWSHFKRMVYGIYHKISRKHSQSYTDEFTLRNNTRQYSSQERFDLVLSIGIGTRLTYQQLISN